MVSDREFRVHDKSHQKSKCYRDKQYNCKYVYGVHPDVVYISMNVAMSPCSVKRRSRPYVLLNTITPLHHYLPKKKTNTCIFNTQWRTKVGDNPETSHQKKPRAYLLQLTHQRAARMARMFPLLKSESDTPAKIILCTRELQLHRPSSYSYYVARYT